MFGYIGPCRDELKIREEAEYKAWYCGLCKCIGGRYGQGARLALSYDCAFVALLLAGVSGEGATCLASCPFHPFKKRPMALSGPSVSFAADLDILLAWYKLADDWRDERKLGAPMGRLALAGPARRAQARAPQLDAAIRRGIAELIRLEKEGCKELDAPADAFARLMRAVGEQAPLPEGSARRVVPQVLYHMGRWVYLMDAWDDRAKDGKRGAYNAFLAAAAGEERARFLLALSQNEALGAYELLDIEAHKGLLDNILYEGCAARMRGVLEAKDEQSL